MRLFLPDTEVLPLSRCLSQLWGESTNSIAVTKNYVIHLVILGGCWYLIFPCKLYLKGECYHITAMRIVSRSAAQIGPIDDFDTPIPAI